MVLQEEIIKFSTENLQLKPKFNKRLVGSAVFEALTDSFVRQFDVMQNMENYEVAVPASAPGSHGLANPIDYLNYIGGDQYDGIVDAISGAVAEDITNYRTNIKPHLERAFERVCRSLSNRVEDHPMIKVEYEGTIFSNEDLLNFLSVSAMEGINYQFPLMKVRNSDTVDKILALLKDFCDSDGLGMELNRYNQGMNYEDVKRLIGELFFGHNKELFYRFYGVEAKVFFMPLRTPERQLLLTAYFIMQLVRRNADQFEFEDNGEQYLDVCERLLGQPILTHMQALVNKRTGDMRELIIIKAHNANITKDNRICVEEIAFHRLQDNMAQLVEVLVGAVVTRRDIAIRVGDVIDNANTYRLATQRYYNGKRNEGREDTRRILRKEIMACICDYRDKLLSDDIMVEQINHRLLNGTDVYFPSIDMTCQYAMTEIWGTVFNAFRIYIFPEYQILHELSHLSVNDVKTGEDPQDVLTKQFVENQVIQAVMQMAQNKQANS